MASTFAERLADWKKRDVEVTVWVTGDVHGRAGFIEYAGRDYVRLANRPRATEAKMCREYFIPISRISYIEIIEDNKVERLPKTKTEAKQEVNEKNG